MYTKMKCALSILAFLPFLSVTCDGYREPHRWHRAHQNYLRYRQPHSLTLAHPTPMENDDSDLTGRIIGGRNAHAGEVPYQLHIRVNYAPNKFRLCGAALVELYSIQFALTAAHCVYSGYPTPRSPVATNKCKMIAGDRSKRLVSGFEQLKTAHRIVMHEQYSGVDLEKYANDLAIIFYKTPFTLNSNVQPIDLPEWNWPQPVYPAPVQISGWGIDRVGGSTTPDILQVLNMTVLPTSACKSWGYNEQTRRGDPRLRITNKYMCLLDAKDGKSSCYGDSGGPAVATDKKTGWKYLAGISSFSIGLCGSKREPNMYVFLPPYMDWIRIQVSDWINTVQARSAIEWD